MRVTVFTGPVLGKDDFPYRGALIPKSFWKVVTVVAEDGRPSATAYEISQEGELSELEFVFGAYKTFQCSIRSIEKKTSLSFGELSRYDGYSVTESTTGTVTKTELQSLEMVRI
jgi:endonuclease G, mitochondrial